MRERTVDFYLLRYTANVYTRDICNVRTRYNADAILYREIYRSIQVVELDDKSDTPRATEIRAKEKMCHYFLFHGRGFNALNAFFSLRRANISQISLADTRKSVC